MKFLKKLMLVLLGLVLCTALLLTIFKPMIADYITDLMNEVSCICVAPEPYEDADISAIP